MMPRDIVGFGDPGLGFRHSHASDARDGSGPAENTARVARAAGSAAGCRPGSHRGRGLRRLPHRSACRRRRIARSEAADRAGARDRRPRRSDRTGRRAFRAWRRASACRGSARPAGFVRIAASGRENLCDAPVFTGYTRDGGYATHTLANARFSFRCPRTSMRPRPPRCCAPA